MGPIIGDCIVVPHIIGVRSIEAVGAMIKGILRHLRGVMYRSVVEEEFLSKGWLMFLGAGEMRGRVKEAEEVIRCCNRVPYSAT